MILRQLTDEISLKPINNIKVGALSNLVDNSQQTIVTLTASGDTYIYRISCSGDVYAKYQLYIGDALKETKRVSERSVDFFFLTPLLLNDGEKIDVKVIHAYTTETPNFDATIYSRV